MAKSKPAAEAISPASSDDWRVEDALRCLQRAEEVQADKALMKKVATLAAEKAKELDHVRSRLGRLVAAGRLSPKQEAKLAPH